MSEFEYEPGDDEEVYSVDVKAVSEDKRMLPMTRKLAKNLIKNSYYTIGDFLLSLKDKDIQDLQALAEDENDIDAVGHIIVITELLALGEGLPRGTQLEVSTRVDLFNVYVAIDGLRRKGLVKAHHINMSLDIDPDSDKPVVEKIPGMNYKFDDEKDDD